MNSPKQTNGCWPQEFINQYPISKTLRFKLIPQGKTQEWIDKEGFLETDEKRAEDSKKVKEFIDDYHRWFIDDVLRSAEVGGWDELEKALNSGDGDGKEKAVARLQEKQRKSLVECFSARPEFGPLTNKPGDLFKKYLPTWMKAHDYDERDVELVNSFNGFTGYFSKLMENRNNMYAVKSQATAIANRAVNENFSKYSANKKMVDTLKREAPSISSGIDALAPRLPYNMYLAPQGITNYNERIGELNKFLNEAYQQGRLAKRHRAQTLYKQILCEGDSSFVVPSQIEDDAGLFDAIKKLLDFWGSFGNEGSTQRGDVDPLVASQTIGEVLAQSDSSMVFIDGKNISDFASIAFDNQKELLQAVEYCASEQCGPVRTKKIAEKWSERKGLFSIEELLQAYTAALPEKKPLTFISVSEKYAEKIKGCCDEIIAAKTAFEKLEASYQGKKPANPKALITNDKDIRVVKNLLDGLKNLERALRVLEVPADKDRDEVFYAFLDGCLAQIMCVDALYNRVRNYVTQKPFSNKKFKLNFNCPTLGNGWDKNKERENHCVILRKNGRYYLAVSSKSSRIDLADFVCAETTDHYEKMIYRQISDPAKDLPNLLCIDGETVRKTGHKDDDGVNRQLEALKNKYLPDDINRIRKARTYSKTSESFSVEDSQQYTRYYMQRLIEYKGSDFDFNFKNANEYESYSSFLEDVGKQTRQIAFQRVSAKGIDSLVEEGKLYLFLIYNKDYSKYATGNKNLHTLYWEQIFSKKNAEEGFPFWLNGGAELFYRRKSIDQPSSHKKGSILLNKTYTDEMGARRAIPDDVYRELSALFNTEKLLTEVPLAISEEVKTLYNSGLLETREAPHEIVKDRRYTQDQFSFHVPIRLNANSDGNDLAKTVNDKVLKHAVKDNSVTLLGIDRGERHLLYLCLINQDGKILMQKTLNTVAVAQQQNAIKVDYRQKLDNREKERDKARKSWQSIGKIAELKEGYLSQVVHEIAEIVTSQNAIVVMEDLNFGFKRGRFKVEKQVYQKFEKQLIDKFAYLAKKPKGEFGIWDDGGIARAYQLVPKFESFKKLGKQHGAIFYVPAWNTSHIDPATGFMNQFRFSNDTVDFWHEFFGSMRSIAYNEAEDYFEFCFAYSEFPGSMVKGKDHQDVWTACSWGDGYLVNHRDKNSGKWVSESIDVNGQIKALLEQEGIDYSDGSNIKAAITQLGDKEIKQLGWLFRRVVQLRNSRTGTEEDYILSPVKDANGRFFDSRNAGDGLPQDADANGAYHIALKGLQALDDIEEDKDGLLRLAKSKKGIGINEKWTHWIQSFHKQQK